MEPVVEAATTILGKLRGDIRQGLEGQVAEALNWKPTPDGNSIAGLLAHMLESSTFLLQLGLGNTIPRDREAQFAATAPDAGALLALVDEGWPRLLDAARAYTPETLAATRELRGNPVTGAWCLLHTCEHLMEHWGQIQLTRDLYAARR